MLGVRRTAESNKAKRMPISGPPIRAVKGLRERPRVKFLHHSGADVHIEGIGPAQRLFSCGPRPANAPTRSRLRPAPPLSLELPRARDPRAGSGRPGSSEPPPTS
jgi:hypothetical protein